MADRPEHTKVGTVSVDVVSSVIDSADTVADAVGAPEPGSVLWRLTPDSAFDAAGVPTPDDVSDDMLAKLDEQFGIDYPAER